MGDLTKNNDGPSLVMLLACTLLGVLDGLLLLLAFVVQLKDIF